MNIQEMIDIEERQKMAKDGFWTRCREGLWPTITDKETAKKASRHGVWAAGFCAVATAVFAWFEFMVGRVAFIDAFFFALIALGIYRMFRFAAVAGLVLYIWERIDMWTTYGPKNPVVAIIITVAFINGIRGTFAYHKLANRKTNLKKCPTCRALQDATIAVCPNCGCNLANTEV